MRRVDLVAAVAEQCADLYTLVAAAQSIHESVPSRGARHDTWQAAVAALARLPAEETNTTLATNLLAGLFARGELGSEDEVIQVLHEWQTARSQLTQEPKVKRDSPLRRRCSTTCRRPRSR